MASTCNPMHGVDEECWICHEGAECAEKLCAAPCKCNKHSHESCLLRWTLPRMHPSPVAGGRQDCQDARAVCEVCGEDITDALARSSLSVLAAIYSEPDIVQRLSAPAAAEPPQVQIVVRTESLERENRAGAGCRITPIAGGIVLFVSVIIGLGFITPRE